MVKASFIIEPPDGEVRSFLAVDGDYMLVTNSRHLIKILRGYPNRRDISFDPCFWPGATLHALGEGRYSFCPVSHRRCFKVLFHPNT